LIIVVEMEGGISGKSSEGSKADAVLFRETKSLPGIKDSRRARGSDSMKRAFRRVTFKVDWGAIASGISASGEWSVLTAGVFAGVSMLLCVVENDVRCGKKNGRNESGQ
jgi:hypothetical protein